MPNIGWSSYKDKKRNTINTLRKLETYVLPLWFTVFWEKQQLII